MDLSGDRRAQAMQVGAVVLVGVAIVALSVYQVTSVPSQNRQFEAAHNDTVAEQLQGVREAILATARNDSAHSATVTLGTDYPNRVVAVNPSPSTGRLGTFQPGPSGRVAITNATALRPETDDYWNGSARTLSTRSIGYTPEYNELTNAPSYGYGTTLAYSLYGESPFGQSATIRGGAALSNQTLIQGNRITLITLDGTLAERGSENVSISARPVSVSNTTIPIANTTNDSIRLDVPTHATNESWQRALEPQLLANGGRVESFSCSVADDAAACGTLTITLSPVNDEAPYELRMARVGVGNETSSPDPRYLTNVTDRRVSVPENASRELVVEVRDGYNNPVANRSVNLTVVDPSVLDRLADPSDGNVTVGQLRSEGDRGGAIEATTNRNGRAVVRYRAPESINGSEPTTVRVLANRTGDPNPTDDTATANATSFNVTVTNADDSPVSHTLSFNESAFESQPGVRCGANRCIYDRSDGQLTVPVEANATSSNRSVGGAPLTFANRDSDIVRYARADNATNAAGRATATINVSQPGTTALAVVGGENTVGEPDRLTLTIGNQVPNARGAYVPQNATSGSQVQFDARDSGDPDGRITEYEWEFGDGSRAFGPRPTHTYNRSGSYNATLTVTDNFGAEDTTSAVIEIANRPPEAAFDYPLTVPAPGQAIGFDASGSGDPDGEIVRYEWDFGDGSEDVTTELPTTSHAFDQPGTYVVSLRVTDGDGDTDVIQKTVTVDGGGSAPSATNSTSLVRRPTAGAIG